jgi:type I restriction enzyme S subunit
VKKSWPLVPLGEVLKPVSRPVVVDPEKTYKILGAHWYAEGLYIKDVLPGSEIRADKAYRVEEGDFVYNRLFAWKGSFAVAAKEHAGCYVSNEFPCFSVNQDRADPSYLWKYFTRSSAWDEALSLSTGGTPTSRNRLKEEQFLALKIPLPPVLEQRRIVTRIEDLAAKINEARTLRQRTAEEAEALSHSGVEAVFRKLRNIVGTKTLADVCHTITDGDHNTPRFSDEGFRFIFVGNVSSARLHFENSKRVSPDYFKTLKPQRLPERGDILYSAVDATLGVPAVVNTNEPFCFQRHVAILKPNRKLVESQFIWHMLRSRTVFEKAWTSTTGSAQPTVPLRAIRELPIPVPPLPEQRHIVEELDSLQERVDSLKKLHAETAAELDGLLPSILDKAFKGEL